MARKIDPQNQQARREQILSAAAQVFSKTGYSRATTKQIASAAGISEGLVYTYFQSKAELLVAMLNQLTRSSSAALPGDASLPTMVTAQVSQTLTRPRVDNAMFAAVIAEVLVNPELRQSYREQRVSASMDQFKDFLRSRVAAGEIPQQDVDTAARACFALTLGLGILRIIGDPLLQPDHPHIQELAEAIGGFLVKALS